MLVLWRGLKVAFLYMIILGLIFAGAVFGVLLYGKWMDRNGANYYSVAYAETLADPYSVMSDSGEDQSQSQAEEQKAPKKDSAMIDAPIIRQYPELPSGCELISLTMLINYYGIPKGKMDLVPELPRDETPLRLAKDGTVVSWGNPNNGFVGDVTGKTMRGFSIYHGALLGLMKEYIPSAFDLTGKSFEEIEQQISDGYPVVIWTTINFKLPQRWLVWDTPIGPIRTTNSVHAVLLVGYDEHNVYVNDPASGKAKLRIDKAQFIETWEALGTQAISYNEPRVKEDLT